MTGISRPLRVSLLAFPDAVVSTLTGIYDVLNAFSLLAGMDEAIPDAPPFRVEIVGAAPGAVTLASGMPLVVQRAVAEVEATDIVIVPSVVVGRAGWQSGRYPEFVAWATRMHQTGAILCSACSGLFLLAETGLFDGRPVTVHWGYAEYFRRAFPRVPLLPERVLVVSGERDDLVSSGASMTWHDLVLYLIARHVGTTAAQAVARSFALQWHHEGLTPYIVFRGRIDHDDAVIADAQAWLDKHFAVATPVEEMVRHSGLAERTFSRRFIAATGLSPLDYAQRLRVEDAKRRLERTEASIDEISWQVGYEDPAFFRRLFRRTTGLAPGAYRRKFRVPSFAGP
jgi:transcriptional regulator GlxA family with amidase domain